MTNEVFSRVLIDKELEFSGLNLLNTEEVRFQLSNEAGRGEFVMAESASGTRSSEQELRKQLIVN